MRYHDIQLTGSLSVTGSLSIPNHPNTGSATALTGSIYHDTTDGIIRVYNGTQWQVVGEQTASAAGGGAVNTNIEYLLIAGGGGGGAYDGGGGGAGGYLSSSIASVTSGSSFTVTVGAGGAGQITSTQSQDGTDSSIAGATISTITAVGGGKGGGYTGAFYGASNGGSGGGGTYAVITTGGSGTFGQGNDGGDGDGGTNAGGGGGAGSAGGDATSSVGGNGGSGLSSIINGTSVARAGGGGGAGYPAGGGSAGSGADGGGNGGANSAGTAGTANTGGGGGGSQDTASPPNNAGGSGGSGVAIFAYDSGSFSGLGGIKSSRSDGYVVHTFNSSGTLTIGGPNDNPIIPQNNFDVLTFTSPGSINTSTQVTGLTFKPDLVWIKTRNFQFYPRVTDVVRGVDKAIYPSDTLAENGEAGGYYNVLSFNNDGFNYRDYQESTANQVAWCWKAGGTAVTNTDYLFNAEISANPAAGFSIVKTQTGTSTSAVEVQYGEFKYAHGLNQTPELIITKVTSTTGGWDTFYYPNGTGSTVKGGALDTTGTFYDYTIGTNMVGINSTFAHIWNYPSANASPGVDIITYNFHSVPGYQKIGSYTGTGAGGNTVTTGFKPKFVMIKNSSAIYEWVIWDSKRNAELNPDSTATENGTGDPADITFTSTGFTLNNAEGATNQNNGTMIYLAIAE